MIEISLILAVRNDAKNITSCLNSIWDDMESTCELIIVDDASTDHTAERISKFLRNKNNIKVITNFQQEGLASSLNKAVKNASGKYLCRMDSDDINIKGRISVLSEYLDSNLDVAVVGCQAFKFRSKINTKIGSVSIPICENSIASRIIFDSPLIHPTAMIRASVFNNLGGYDTSYTYSQDYELWARMYVNGYKIGNVKFHGLYYRVSEDNNKDKITRRFTFTSMIRKTLILNICPDMPLDSIDLHLYISGDTQMARYYPLKSIKALTAFYSVLAKSYGLKFFLPILIRKVLKLTKSDFSLALKIISFIFFNLISGNLKSWKK
ncbi:glycosyltransferase [Paraglaciecola chathamensis]|uniref:Glycosyltransferase n=1 Tax=Paraglaciecola chathamensis TaxID=368405 RepID=A0ABS0W9Y2_9ALTE|nr:glycosyltransferase [Paraglaciecola chathamensis]